MNLSCERRSRPHCRPAIRRRAALSAPGLRHRIDPCTGLAGALHGISVRRKRRAEGWCEIPDSPELLHAHELVHALRSAPAKAASKPLWAWSRATAYRKIARTMADADIEGPQACPKGLHHSFGIAVVAAGVPPPTIAAALGHADLQTATVFTTAAGLEARDFLARMREREANSAGSSPRRPPERSRSSHGVGYDTERWSAVRAIGDFRISERAVRLMVWRTLSRTMLLAKF